MDSQRRPERYLSVKEFGWAIGWSDDTVRRLIKRRVIRAVALPQIGSSKRTYRRVRIPEGEVARFVRLHSTT